MLRVADVVVHDRLADAACSIWPRRRRRRVDVGKAPGGPVQQDEINLLLVAEGQAGRTVVRLKGGILSCSGGAERRPWPSRPAGCLLRSCPGITSAIAVPAYAGVPVTHRGLSTSFTVVTGHSRHAVDPETNWGRSPRPAERSWC